MSAEVEKQLRVWLSKEGVSLLIRQNPDAPGYGINIQTTDEDSEKWFGKQDLCISDKGFAVTLAWAIKEMAEEITK